jgi:hypothetical protein
MNTVHGMIAFLRAEADLAEARAKQLRLTAALIQANQELPSTEQRTYRTVLLATTSSRGGGVGAGGTCRQLLVPQRKFRRSTLTLPRVRPQRPGRKGSRGVPLADRQALVAQLPPPPQRPPRVPRRRTCRRPGGTRTAWGTRSFFTRMWASSTSSGVALFPRRLALTKAAVSADGEEGEVRPPPPPPPRETNRRATSWRRWSISGTDRTTGRSGRGRHERSRCTRRLGQRQQDQLLRSPPETTKRAIRTLFLRRRLSPRLRLRQEPAWIMERGTTMETKRRTITTKMRMKMTTTTWNSWTPQRATMIGPIASVRRPRTLAFRYSE